MQDNLKIVEYNVQEIENYMDIINEIKKRIVIDENGLTTEVKEVIVECKNEIINLRESIEKLQNENLEIIRDNCTMAKQLHVNNLLMDVKDSKSRKKIKKLLLQYDTDMKYLDQNAIDNIFNVVLGDAANNG